MIEVFVDIFNNFIEDKLYVLLLLSFIISYILVPPIILISKKLKLGDKGGGRKIHKKVIPTLGGIAIIISFMVSLLAWSPNFTIETNFKNNEFLFGGISVLILLIVGVRDDLIPMKSMVKLVVQVLTAFIVVVFGKLYFVDFDGLFGLEVIPVFYGKLLSIIIIVAIVNAYNLIDGIDGLASVMAMISSLFFAMWFILGNNIVMYSVAIGLFGSLLGFLMLNKSPAKIFMGDTGSMFVGFILAILAIRFIDFNAVVKDSYFHVENAPLIAMTTMLVPVLDVIRVFVDRMLAKKSPFFPDKSHIHHLLLKIGFTHNMVVSLLGFLSVTFIFISVLFNDKLSFLVFIFMCMIFIGLSIGVKYMIRGKIKNIRNS